jgi:hypothetical protein
VLVVDDGVLALLDQQLDEVAEVGAELLPELAGGHQRVLAGLLLEFLPPQKIMKSCFFLLFSSFFLTKSYYPIPWRDSISRPIAPHAETIPLDHAAMMESFLSL